MTLNKKLNTLKNATISSAYRLVRNKKQKFTCPICSYSGPFMDLNASTGIRRHAKCPNCKGLERHRIQFLTLQKIVAEIDTSNLKILHFAPEPFFREYFLKQFREYESADISMKNVNHNADLQQLPFDDQSYDFVFASHVLEHVQNDEKAISEIRRILRPNGIAILPVPIVATKTVEYPEANPNEANHCRAPGLDYFKKYEQNFSIVKTFKSDNFPEQYQLFIYEDRSQWPTKECPLRPPMAGKKHLDVVPVCYA
jgi:SAM-dependent methyltransferase